MEELKLKVYLGGGSGELVTKELARAFINSPNSHLLVLLKTTRLPHSNTLALRCFTWKDMWMPRLPIGIKELSLVT